MTTVYLTPIFPGRSAHRYDASTFDHVDPLLGGDDALARLSEALHSRGMRIMGRHHDEPHGRGTRVVPPPARTRAAPSATSTTGSTGDRATQAGSGTATCRSSTSASSELGPRLIDGPGSVIGRWLQAPWSLDGWRVDVANMTGRHADEDHNEDVGRRLRATLAEVNPDAALISEHFHDARGDLSGETWHGNMNYTAFSNPVDVARRAGQRHQVHGCRGLAMPRAVPVARWSPRCATSTLPSPGRSC